LRSCHNHAAGSVGFQIGGEAKDIIMFMPDAALWQFQANKGWETGDDVNIAPDDIGGGKLVDFSNPNDPIAAFVFDVNGLMVDISLKGA
jgi:lipid-binding SYLF domain-containing protein